MIFEDEGVGILGDAIQSGKHAVFQGYIPRRQAPFLHGRKIIVDQSKNAQL